MSRYRPSMVDGAPGFALGDGRNETPPPGPGVSGDRLFGLGRLAPPPAQSDRLISEPDQVSGTIEQWIAYRGRVLPLAKTDPTMRVALAVAEAQIAKLRARMQQKRDSPGDDEDR